MDVSTLCFVDSAGYHYSDFPTFLLYFQGVFQDIYGEDIYLGADSQDGQFVSILAQAAYDTAINGASTYNSFSPSTAQGVGLSRDVKINGLRRINATNSTVELLIGGTYLTQLTNAVAVDILQQQWSIPATVIPFTGTITVTATSVTSGAIAALANTITGIFTPTNGWQTVNNPSAATVGQAYETDAALRARQTVSTSIPAETVFDATLGGVENVPGVVAVMGYENDTNTTDGNGLPPHSIAVVVSGGDDTAIAQTIQVYKTPGTQTDGNTTVTVLDTRGVPIAINFYRPTDAEIGVQVTIVPGTYYLTSTAALIQSAVASFITGLPNGGIGATIVLTQLYAVAYLIGNPLGSSYTITSIELELNGGGYSSSNIDLAFTDIPVCDPNTDVVVIT